MVVAKRAKLPLLFAPGGMSCHAMRLPPFAWNDEGTGETKAGRVAKLYYQWVMWVEWVAYINKEA